MIARMIRRLSAILLFSLPLLATDPTILRRKVADVPESQNDFTAPGCHYRAVFGNGDADAKHLRGITRFGQITLDAGGTCKPVNRAGEEQIVVVLAGSAKADYGGQNVPLKTEDYLYVPPGVQHTLSAGSGAARMLLMGFRAQADPAPAPAKPQVANMGDVKLEVVGSHPPSTLYRLLLGQTTSTRDKLACAKNVTSLFMMEFAPSGTNIPPHHDTEEEIYYVMDGHGQMVAGSGADGVEGKFPTSPGEAFFFRLNATVGFYNETKEGEPKARILAVRSLYPFRR
jgi:mannose-6-phosphate isomerase-like protein (cupin superfamily)